MLLAPGELAAVTVGELLERAQADDLLDVEAVRVQAAKQRDALAHREEVLQRGLLEQNTGLLPKARSERLAAVADLARKWAAGYPP